MQERVYFHTNKSGGLELDFEDQYLNPQQDMVIDCIDAYTTETHHAHIYR